MSRARKIFVEVAVLDDHERVMWHVLGHELGDHLAIPMSIMFVFVLGGILLSVKLALRPVERGGVAGRAHRSARPRTDHRALPGCRKEIANLGAAVNRMLVAHQRADAGPAGLHDRHRP